MSQRSTASPVQVWRDRSPGRIRERERSTHVMQIVYDLTLGGSESLALAIAQAGCEGGGAAAEELMTEYVSKQRAAKWGVINKGLLAAEEGVRAARVALAAAEATPCTS